MLALTKHIQAILTSATASAMILVATAVIANDPQVTPLALVGAFLLVSSVAVVLVTSRQQSSSRTKSSLGNLSRIWGLHRADRATDFLNGFNEAASELFTLIDGAGSTTALLRDMSDKQRAVYQAVLQDREEDMVATRFFVAPSLDVESAEADAVQTLMSAVASNSQVRLEAEAGAGKTVLMIRLYRELIDQRAANRTGPVPMLILSRNLRTMAPDVAARASDDEWRRAFAEKWLANRGVTLDTAALQAFATSLWEAIGRGDVVLLIDGFDELAVADRRSLQLLKQPRVVASGRPSDQLSEWPSVALHRGWNGEQRAGYLERRFPGAQWIARLVRETSDPAREWMWTPRYWHILADAIERDGADRTAEDIIKLVLNEERFVRAAINVSVDRAIALRARPDLKDTVMQCLMDAAAAGAHGADADNGRSDAWTIVALITEFVARSPESRLLITDERAADVLAGRWLARHLALSPHLRKQAWGGPVGLRWSSLVVRAAARDLKAARIDVDLWAILRDAARDSAGLAGRLVLFDLALELAAARDVADVRLDGIVLDGAELRGAAFDRVHFNGTSLAWSDMRKARFTGCSFKQTTLVGADASDAIFDDSRFNLSGDAAAKGMWLVGTTFLGSSADDSKAALVRTGATDNPSRYDKPWILRGWAGLLGGDYERAEAAYVKAIRAAIVRWPDDAIHLVDLMAGGSGQRLADLLEQEPRLHVLGIDRDKEDGLLRKFGKRYKHWQVELHGQLDRKDNGNLRNGFRLPRQAHIIVAKKALHELERTLQPLVLAACRNALRVDGCLIIFTDSPGRISNTDLSLLASLRSALVAADDSDNRSAAETGSAEVLARLREHESTGARDAAVALFCNAWVMVKDWANGNHHELENRYFSGADEISTWAGDADLAEVSPGIAGIGSQAALAYRIAVPRFNRPRSRFFVPAGAAPAARAWPALRHATSNPLRAVSRHSDRRLSLVAVGRLREAARAAPRVARAGTGLPLRVRRSGQGKALRWLRRTRRALQPKGPPASLFAARVAWACSTSPCFFGPPCCAQPTTSTCHAMPSASFEQSCRPT
jgi:hypothetical protein